MERNMTDELAAKPAKKPRGVSFKPGYDPRRWLSGRGRKSPEQREGEAILRAVIWEELSREFDVANMKPLEQSDTIDALRLMVRGWIKKRPEEIADRIAGKVTEKHEVTGKDGESLNNMTPEQIAVKVAALLAKAEERKKNAG
jgi:hypothetical protein